MYCVTLCVVRFICGQHPFLWGALVASLVLSCNICSRALSHTHTCMFLSDPYFIHTAVPTLLARGLLF